MLLVMLSAGASAQCCLGAQDQQHTAVGGRFRATATSLTGTGIGAHGPYRFRFDVEHKTRSGAWAAVGSFERSWDSRAHFHMTIVASQSGNGLLLDCSMEPDVVLLSCTGEELARLPELPGRRALNLRLTEQGEVWLSSIVDAQSRRARLFAPLAIVEREERRIGDPREQRWETADDGERWWPRRGDGWIGLRRAIRWRPELGDSQAPRAAAAIAALTQEDPAAWPQAHALLVELGWSAKAALAAAARAQKGPAAGRLRAAHDEIAACAFGHNEPWRNLDLLVALANGPDDDLAADALAQWRNVAPPGAPCKLEWLAEHAAALAWDERTGRHVRNQSHDRLAPTDRTDR